MKTLPRILLTLALGSGMLFAQAQKSADAKKPAAAPANAVADELKQLENEWMTAVKAKDAQKLGEILADNWTAISWEGKLIDKAKELADMKAPGNSLDTFEMGPMTVKAFGNTAVVQGSDTEKSTEKGKDTSGKYLWTDVFVKEGGKWRAVSSQSTKVAK